MRYKKFVLFRSLASKDILLKIYYGCYKNSLFIKSKNIKKII